jgi:hypothetical protein
MKCHACKSDTDEKDWKRLNGYLTVTRETDGYHAAAVEEVTPMICPNCGTLRITAWWLHEPAEE